MGFIHSQEGPVNTAQHSLKQKQNRTSHQVRRKPTSTFKCSLSLYKIPSWRYTRKHWFFRLRVYEDSSVYSAGCLIDLFSKEHFLLLKPIGALSGQVLLHAQKQEHKNWHAGQKNKKQGILLSFIKVLLSLFSSPTLKHRNIKSHQTEHIYLQSPMGSPATYISY